jgi:hypothetical protein
VSGKPGYRHKGLRIAVRTEASAVPNSVASSSSTLFTLTRPVGPATDAKLSSHMATRCSKASRSAFAAKVCWYTGNTHTCGGQEVERKWNQGLCRCIHMPTATLLPAAFRHPPCKHIGSHLIVKLRQALNDASVTAVACGRVGGGAEDDHPARRLQHLLAKSGREGGPDKAQRAS